MADQFHIYSVVDMVRLMKAATGMNLRDSKDTVDRVLEIWEKQDLTHLYIQKGDLEERIREITQKISDLDTERRTWVRNLEEIDALIDRAKSENDDDLNRLSVQVYAKMTTK